MKQKPSPPAKSVVAKMVAEAQAILAHLSDDYGIGWDEAYDRRRSSFAVIGSGARYEDDGAPSNSTLVHLADTESRRDALQLGAKRLEDALDLLRSSQGLIDPAHKPSASQWTQRDLRATEAAYHDSKRLQGRKRGHGPQKQVAR